MYQFQCDYVAGCHPEVLEALTRTNLTEMEGYCRDPFCRSAEEKIRTACQAENAMVRFLMGGTQANITCIAATLLNQQGVISPVTGHINGHEAGAIEATGHKVMAVPSHDGRVKAADVESVFREYARSDVQPLCVEPAMLYVSFPTETGTVYSLAELEELSALCHGYGASFYVDGARMAYGLAASPDVTLADLARICDIFYIGGTKCGALCGEAVVITNSKIQRYFDANVRQRGALFAKGRLGGVQFDALFTNGLYEKIGRHALEAAERLRAAFAGAGIKMVGSSTTNQLFVLLTPAQANFLKKNFLFKVWRTEPGGLVCARFCTSWSTTAEAVAELERHIACLPGVSGT